MVTTMTGASAVAGIASDGVSWKYRPDDVPGRDHRRGWALYASVRRYPGSDPGPFAEVASRRQDPEAPMRKAPGFRAWYLVRTGDGMMTISLSAPAPARPVPGCARLRPRHTP